MPPVHILAVGGGGAGGASTAASNGGGGGGAGDVVDFVGLDLGPGSYVVTIGAGGAGVTNGIGGIGGATVFDPTGVDLFAAAGGPGAGGATHTAGTGGSGGGADNQGIPGGVLVGANSFPGGQHGNGSTAAVTISYLLVGGGGAGGPARGGGGGGGGVLSGTLSLNAGTYPVVIGPSDTASQWNGLIALQGGEGGGDSMDAGFAGGCGGGGSKNADGGAGSQGGAGGDGNFDLNSSGGGGGGGGASGQNAALYQGGNGGNGFSSSITGAAVVYAGGGGGNNDTLSGTGGTGGGGNGGTGGTSTAGTNGRGGGGGGGESKLGGSGVFIISYPTGSFPAGVTGGTLTTSGGRDIRTFTASGTLTINASSTTTSSGGGGGASHIGGNGVNTVGGAGGAGYASTLQGVGGTFGGGGGGMGTGGGNGAGGTGGGAPAGTGAAATANTGGGGGGNSGGSASGNGGSGIVIIEYVTGTLHATGGTITYTGKYTTHVFTSSGVFVVSHAVILTQKSHVGAFQQGQVAAPFTILVTNVGSVPTAYTVAVADTPSSGLTLTGMSGTGWTCVAGLCTRSDALAPGASYPPITALVTISGVATSPQTNQANDAIDTVILGGEIPVPIDSVKQWMLNRFDVKPRGGQTA